MMSVQASDPKEPTSTNRSEPTCQGAYYFNPDGDIVGIYYDAGVLPENLTDVTIDSPCGDRYNCNVNILKVKERKFHYVVIVSIDLEKYKGWKYRLVLPKAETL